MISLYSGTPGSGKSYHAAKIVYDRLRYGYSVIANTTFNLSMIQSKNREKFVYKDNSELTVKFLEDYALQHHVQGREGQTLLLIDECSVKFNSRDYARGDRMQWIVFFQQHRKLGYNVVLISQSDRLIDRQIRAFIEYDVKHRSVKNYKIFGRIVSLLSGGSLFAAVTVWYGMREKTGSQLIPYSRKIGKFYNTFEIFSDSKKEEPNNKNKKASVELPVRGAGSRPERGRGDPAPKRKAVRKPTFIIGVIDDVS